MLKAQKRGSMSGRPPQSLLGGLDLGTASQRMLGESTGKRKSARGKSHHTEDSEFSGLAQAQSQESRYLSESKDDSASCTPNSNVNFSKNAVLNPPSLDQEHAPLMSSQVSCSHH